jgi:hypothetical protein
LVTEELRAEVARLLGIDAADVRADEVTMRAMLGALRAK